MQYQVWRCMVAAMTRPLRIEYPGAVCHVTARGNARMPVFAHDGDRVSFLDLIEEPVERLNWRCYAYCPTGSYYYMLVETVDITSIA